MEEVDTVIVGGGLSGCACYRELVRRLPHERTLLIEARDRLGGRTCTKQVEIEGEVYSIDVGGQWIGRVHKNMLSLCSEFG